MEQHKILITGSFKGVSPKRYWVSIYCRLVDHSEQLAEFFSVDDARKYGKDKAFELGLELKDETK